MTKLQKALNSTREITVIKSPVHSFPSIMSNYSLQMIKLTGIWKSNPE
ncbi:MAG: hypothetical protein LUH22_00555 [Bacteroides sp.]|nr:hypothetical protein [Bacteroides sp.]